MKKTRHNKVLPEKYVTLQKKYSMENDKESQPSNHLPITQWPEEDRPREKMVRMGKKNLTDSELIAILLRTGIRGASAIDLAKNLLKRANGRLTELSRLEVTDLQNSNNGLGMAKAVTILAALELGNRMLKEVDEGNEEVIRTSEDLFRYTAHSIINLPTEEFWAVYLNQRNKVIWKQRIGAGGLTQTTVDLRIIFRAALEHNSIAVAVIHNHPSGNLRPSPADKNLTKHIADAGSIMNVKLIEHLIVGILPSGKPDYFSFTDNGLL